MTRFALAVAVTALLLAGCSSDDGDAEPTGATTPVTVKGTNAETALLTDVTASREDGVDRIVFTFRDEAPGYDVRYVSRPILADGSGDEVEIEGDHVLQVRMETALDADLTQEDAPLTYTGPQRFSPTDTETVVELARTGGFEAVLTWVVGLDERVPFAVTTESDPPRVVIDLQTSG